MASITVYSPNHENTIAIYSSVRPWRHVNGHEIRYTNERIDPDDSNVLFFERPQWSADIRMLKQWRKAGKKIWVDHDDNVFQLPVYNPLKDFYDSCRENIVEALQIADVVTTCSESTAKEWRRVCGNSDKVKILPVRYDETLWPIQNRSQNKIIAWRGSNTHRGDLESVQDDLIMFCAENPDWTMIFFGSGHEWLAEKIKRAQFVSTLDFESYKYALNIAAPSIMFIPWVPNVFNAGKSEIAWYEATAAGAVFVCARWGQYANIPAVHYNGKTSAYDALCIAKNNVVQSDSLWQMSVHKMLDGEYNIKHATKIRESILRGLLS
jgi:hypothetical protein